MAAQEEAHWTILDESGEPFRARHIRAGVVDKKPGGHQEVTSKQQSRTAVVKRNLSLVVPWRGNHIDRSITEIDLRETVGPIGEFVVAPNAVDIKTNHVGIGKMCELCITGAVIKVPMGMNDKQRKYCTSLSGKQAHHRVC